ncbi:hypothetical protein [Jeotgalicoccus halotolerans]|uniref:Uncharacterized protein n=1 Tax=Jeotgalicoccus halotolerans TaxID=157227 RepID=A0A3E0B185_9STAP|nr:hypothetical protein [Jeotgalicoccus halotolerans]REG25707.1 hypothetical protein DFR63_0750 [Jeotgalicoccus halotolerans]
MKKVLNIIFLTVIGLILMTVLGFWFTDTSIRPSITVLLVVILAVSVLVKNRLNRETEK